MPPKQTKRVASAPPASSPIAKRSRGAPPVLSRPICHRCAKRIGSDNIAIDCNVLAHKKCDYCSGMRHDCLKVPAEDIKEVNLLLVKLDAVRAMEDDDEDTTAKRDAIAALKKRTKAYKVKSEQLKKKLDKKGGKSKPKDMLAIGLLVLGELEGLRRAANNMVDSFRSINGLEAIGEEDGVVEVMSEESEEEEEDDDDDEE